jgi:hypothetical protein
MDKQDLEIILRKEWEDETLRRYVSFCENPMFDALYDIREKLYELFHPLGITSCSVHNVCHVFSELEYACEDDGALSIVAVTMAWSDSEQLRYDQIYENAKKKVGVTIEAIRKSPVFKDVFVMHGWPNDLTESSVAEHALRHASGSRKLVSYVAKCFTYGVLTKLRSFKDRWAREEELGKLAQTLEGKHEYYAYRCETESMLEKMIHDLNL